MAINLDEFSKLKHGDIIVCIKVDKYHSDWFTVNKKYEVVKSKVFGNYIRDDRNSKHQNIYGHSYFKVKN